MKPVSTKQAPAPEVPEAIYYLHATVSNPGSTLYSIKFGQPDARGSAATIGQVSISDFPGCCGIKVIHDLSIFSNSLLFDAAHYNVKDYDTELPKLARVILEQAHVAHSGTILHITDRAAVRHGSISRIRTYALINYVKEQCADKVRSAYTFVNKRTQNKVGAITIDMT